MDRTKPLVDAIMMGAPTVIEQDKWAIERQHEMLRYPDEGYREVHVKTDGAMIMARSILNRMDAAENPDSGAYDLARNASAAAGDPASPRWSGREPGRLGFLRSLRALTPVEWLAASDGCRSVPALRRAGGVDRNGRGRGGARFADAGAAIGAELPLLARARHDAPRLHRRRIAAIPRGL